MKRKSWLLMVVVTALCAVALLNPGCKANDVDRAIAGQKDDLAIKERATQAAEAKAAELAAKHSAVVEALAKARAEAKDTAAIESALKEAEAKVNKQNAVIAELKDQQDTQKKVIAVLESARSKSVDGEVPIGEFIRGAGESAMAINPAIGGILLLVGSLATNIQQLLAGRKKDNVIAEKTADLEASHEAIGSISVLKAAGLIDLSGAKEALKGCQSDAAREQVNIAEEKAIGLDALKAMAQAKTASAKTAA